MAITTREEMVRRFYDDGIDGEGKAQYSLSSSVTSGTTATAQPATSLGQPQCRMIGAAESRAHVVDVVRQRLHRPAHY